MINHEGKNAIATHSSSRFRSARFQPRPGAAVGVGAEGGIGAAGDAAEGLALAAV
jgi:hypothetical protein